ncbi:VOC family protein [Mollicutes bacterium LVI A0078]|nr:VOC family protein [Mollicutes bacterium LVI A0075]WOO91068.1 VOC family protein [Mollicutes bacterium LVI A0078]
MKIDHIAIWCKDIEEMRDFYETYMLGESSELFTGEDTSFQSYILSFPKSDCKLKLMYKQDIDKFHKDKRFGLAHLSFKLDSQNAVDDLTALIGNGGYKVYSTPHVDETGQYSSLVIDVEGNIIQLIANYT